jgi:hypothetical protein
VCFGWCVFYFCEHKMSKQDTCDDWFVSHCFLGYGSSLTSPTSPTSFG